MGILLGMHQNSAIPASRPRQEPGNSMLKRCLSPLTLVNQLALIVMLYTALGVTGMAISGWLVQGVQGNAHAINEAGSLRMQSYRLLASVPLTEDDQPLIDEMERTAF